MKHINPISRRPAAAQSTNTTAITILTFLSGLLTLIVTTLSGKQPAASS